ncbi:MAG: pyruvate, phosphate dikinase, partial [Gemmatimonadota bacterium]|nr:pyruvate, phosphate dikinase [Gemmatimonadota bacterium]
MRDTLGGKGANLHEMTRLGIPVPPGFTISALLCSDYLENNSLPKDLKTQVEKAMERLEKDSGKRFGDPSNPLLVSVRSGAKFSMPGMMDTILNLGLNDETTIGLEEQTGNGAFAYDSYRRLIQMYGDVVFGVTGNADSDPFEEILHEAKTKNGITREVDLGRDALKKIAESFKTIV